MSIDFRRQLAKARAGERRDYKAQSLGDFGITGLDPALIRKTKREDFVSNRKGRPSSGSISKNSFAASTPAKSSYTQTAVNYQDAPVSDATKFGYYDQDDSIQKHSEFIHGHSSMNEDKQKRYAGDAMDVYKKFGKIDARAYTDESMENALQRSTQYSYDRADRQTGLVLGDIWHGKYNQGDWKWPEAPAKIESNAAEIANQAKKDIEDL